MYHHAGCRVWIPNNNSLCRVSVLVIGSAWSTIQVSIHLLDLSMEVNDKRIGLIEMASSCLEAGIFGAARVAVPEPSDGYWHTVVGVFLVVVGQAQYML